MPGMGGQDEYPRDASPDFHADVSPRADAPAGDAPRRTFLTGGVEIVHEDEHLIIVDKPSGLMTVPPPEQEAPSVFGHIKDYARDKARRRGVRVWIIHRLDKEASGLLVFAKTEQAFHVLKEDFRAKRVHRLYAAVVEGRFSDPQQPAPAEQLTGAIQSYLFEDERGMVHSLESPMLPVGVSRSRDAGFRGREDAPKLAVTHYRVLREGHGRALVQCKLETGRKHQIRVHLASIGHPIAGDRRYRAATDPIDRVCLHAQELGFAHPVTGQKLRFRSPMPGTFEMLVGGADTAAPASASDLSQPAHADTPAHVETSSWEHVAAWYDQLLDDRGSDHHEYVILPGALRLLEPATGQRVLDVACGQGILCRRLAALGVEATGVDSAPSLIAAAKRADATSQYVVGDARNLAPLNLPEQFDAACCVMALMNIEPLAPVLSGITGRLREGGRFVGVILHPAFRSPGQTRWGWDQSGGSEHDEPDVDPRGRSRAAKKARATSATRTGSIEEPTPAQRWANALQFRRVDGYLSPAQTEIVMNPGKAAAGARAVVTMTHHRPIQTYVRALADAGLLVDALEEWSSARTSQPGPRAAAENRARREIPMFLAFRAVKVAARGGRSPETPR